MLSTSEVKKEIPEARVGLTLEQGQEMMRRAKAKVIELNKPLSMLSAMVVRSDGIEVVILEKNPGRLSDAPDI